jgi:hypothetical protein
MSQKIRLEILRCVAVLKVFSKKRNFWFKTRPLLLQETILNLHPGGTGGLVRPVPPVPF